MSAPHRPGRYLAIVAALAGLALATVATFNLRTDPYAIYRWASDPSLRDIRGDIDSRITKSEQLARGDWQVLLLGSSRTQLGVDPHMRLWGDREVYNGALRGGTIYEAERMLRFGLAHDELEEVVLFADFFAFSAGALTLYDFENSRLNGALDLVDFHLGNLLGLHGTEESRWVRERAEEGRPSILDDHGFQSSGAGKRTGTHEVFETVLVNYLTSRDKYADYRTGEVHVESYRTILDLCAERGLPVRVVILPVHASLMHALAERGLWPVYEDWKRLLVGELVASGAAAGVGVEPGAAAGVLDFTSFAGPAGEPLYEDGRPRTAQWFRDASHFGKRFGARVLRRLLRGGGKESAKARELTPDTLEQALADLRAEHADWVARRPDDAAFVARLAAEHPEP